MDFKKHPTMRCYKHSMSYAYDLWKESSPPYIKCERKDVSCYECKKIIMSHIELEDCYDCSHENNSDYNFSDSDESERGYE